ncbi:MAG: hypothetical protein AB1896_20775, partial [Thermodesulfobacteriota bacterium]
GLPVDEDFLSSFRKAAFEAGMSQKQVSDLVAWHNRQFQVVNEKRGREIEGLREEARAALRQEWGKHYDRNLGQAQKAFKMAAEPELQEFLENSGLGSNPLLIKMFYRIGQAVSEDVLVRSEAVSRGPNRTLGGMPMLHFPSLDKK